MRRVSRGPRRSRGPSSLRGRLLVLENRSGYATADLFRFFMRGLVAMGVKKPRHIIVVAAPQRSRGCAEVGTYSEHLRRKEARVLRDGLRMVISIAPPSRFSLRRLAKLFEHEVAHTLGYDHEEMPYRVLWSLGHTSTWAEGSRIRYLGPAPSQL